MTSKKSGICFLVGAGPGDPGLLTLRGREVLSRAQVVIYDHLVNRELLGFAPAEAELIYAGKKAGDHTLPQEEINRLLVENTHAGKYVVRLKGGDPFVFARGAEECLALAEAGQRFEIVPGVSSAIAGPAYAGIPVTQRTVNSVLTIFSGHHDPSETAAGEVYESIGRGPGTKVMLMGVENLRGVARRMITGGAKASLPAAAIRWATRGDQQVVRGTIGDIADEVEKSGLQAPAVVVFGEVAALSGQLAWTANRPLFGRRVVVTRSRAQSGKLTATLRDLGADVYELPLIRREPPPDLREFGELVQDAHSYEWIVFTSANGVDAFFEMFYKIYDDAREVGGVKFAAVGTATAQRIKEHRYHTDLVAENFHTESLAETFRKNTDVENVKILVVRPEETSGTLASELAGMGAIVDEAIAYCTVPEEADRTRAKERLASEGANLVVFTSSSSVRNFFTLNLPVAKGLKFASIGPVTTRTLEECGARPAIEARQHDVPGLVEAITEYFSR
ncbi:MAG: uroporphyrinogen-III C-methyltransferase [Chthoniobacterales bacterium]|jgi:uroporphyrinogen III methyltransferase/synthase